jgi:uncharacterized protein (DUF1778 family)
MGASFGYSSIRVCEFMELLDDPTARRPKIAALKRKLSV